MSGDSTILANGMFSLSVLGRRNANETNVMIGEQINDGGKYYNDYLVPSDHESDAPQGRAVRPLAAAYE